jgi:hypothetical protein
VTCGIWQPLRLVGIDAHEPALLHDVQVEVVPSPIGQLLTWSVSVRAVLVAASVPPAGLQGYLSVQVHGVSGASSSQHFYYSGGVRRADGTREFLVDSVPIVVSNVTLWQPRGFEPSVVVGALYNVSIGTAGQTTTRRVGFRHVELVRDPVPGQVGQTFYFKVRRGVSRVH